jgi:tRNA pseudouridine38-40 synthase
MPKILLEISYLGTHYAGWQKQPNAMSVQEKLEQKLSVYLRENTEILGSSRTDAGVHAKQQYACFQTTKTLDLQQLVYRLNHLLPKDLALVSAREVPESFHPRFDATSRAYQYTISRAKNPFFSENAYLFTPALDLEAMNIAAKILLQYTDFQCFSKVHTDVYTYNCTIEYAYWELRNHQLVFCIKANRFLRGMVRAIVGTLLQVGLGKLSIEGFKQVIESKSRQKAGVSVPAEGLVLVEVNY